MGYIFSRDLSKFRRFITLSEGMTFLYGRMAGWISTIMIIINGIGTVALQITAIGHVANYFFGFDYVIGAAVGAGVMLAYSVYGGFRPIVMTDFFQSVLFFLALPIACGFMLKNFGNAQINFKEFDVLAIYSDKENVLFSLGSLFYMAIPSISAPYLQRALASRSIVQTALAFRRGGYSDICLQ